MVRKSLFLIVALLAVALWSGQAFMNTAVAGDHAYVGAEKCKTCHKKPEDGEQYPKWLESKHAKAYEVLAGDAAKKIAADKGLGDPQQAKECLKCHVTAYDAPAEMLGTKYDVAQGVGCESCHGAGGDYYKKKTMVGIISGEIDPASVGLVIPTKETCMGCHNEESPTFKGFNYDEMLKKIAHPIPDAKKAEYKKG